MWASQTQNGYENIERNGIYMFVTKSCYTAGYAEIYAQGETASAMQYALKSRLVELRTYQTQNGMMSSTPSKRGLPTTNWRLRSLTDEARATDHLRFALIPPMNGVESPAHIVKVIAHRWQQRKQMRLMFSERVSF